MTATLRRSLAPPVLPFWVACASLRSAKRPPVAQAAASAAEPCRKSRRVSRCMYVYLAHGGGKREPCRVYDQCSQVSGAGSIINRRFFLPASARPSGAVKSTQIRRSVLLRAGVAKHVEGGSAEATTALGLKLLRSDHRCQRAPWG